MEARTKRYLAWTLLGIGGTVVVGSDVVEPGRRLHLALTFGGGALMFLGIVAADLLSDSGCLVDGRFAEIHYRSGYFAFVVMGALLVTATLVLINAALAVQANTALILVAVLGLAVYRGSVAWLKRTM